MPKLVIRYPNLVNGKPETLRGIAELENLISSSIVVATADLCHHGVAYGQENAFPVSELGIAFARNNIKNHLSYFSQQEYLEYRQIVFKSKAIQKMLDRFCYTFSVLFMDLFSIFV